MFDLARLESTTAGLDGMLPLVEEVRDHVIAELSPEMSSSATPFASETAAVETTGGPAPDWREELSLKMQIYRTRHKPRAPKYPSLQMPLQLPVGSLETPQTLSDASRSSNALEPALESPQATPRQGPELVQLTVSPNPELEEQPFAPTNLIQFPRSPESEPWDGLAEPVIEQPRILEAPEHAPPKPALGGILLETAPDPQPAEPEDQILRPATILRRGLALALDAAFVGCAIVVWGSVAARITGEIPPQPQLLISGFVSAAVLWLTYQYLLMVYSGTTLGLLACGIELASINGTTPGKEQRRWRFFASLLSSASIMFGYAWVLLDDQQLCWHDRITHTYLRVRERRSL